MMEIIPWNMKDVFIVPKPKKLDSTGGHFVFGGFEDFPEFLMREFYVLRETGR